MIDNGERLKRLKLLLVTIKRNYEINCASGMAIHDFNINVIFPIQSCIRDYENNGDVKYLDKGFLLANKALEDIGNKILKKEQQEQANFIYDLAQKINKIEYRENTINEIYEMIPSNWNIEEYAYKRIFDKVWIIYDEKGVPQIDMYMSKYPYKDQYFFGAEIYSENNEPIIKL